MVKAQTVAEQSNISPEKNVIHGKVLVERYNEKREEKRRHQG
jgi:hypothetical protein